jgi:hypothetical protein
MDLIRRIQKSSLIVLFPLAALSAFLEWKKLPFSVLIGGALGLVNLRGLAWGIQGLLGAEKATGRMLFFSQFRFIMLFLVLGALIYLRLVNILGVLAGFTVVFIMILMEGLKSAREAKIKEK